MNDTVTLYRNKLIHGLYQRALKPAFFRRDPEMVHDRMVALGGRLGASSLGRAVTRHLFGYQHPSLEQELLGLKFANPVGLSAGFDKNAQLPGILPAVGFGFAELGSVTGEPCLGNPAPRLWRLPQSQSLVVYYGLKNDGCEAIAERLRGGQSSIPLGVSVAMTNCADNLILSNAVKDFAKAFRTVEPVADYLTVNISCPNTQSGQPFSVPHKFDYLFDILDEIATVKPIFIKLSPDLPRTDLDTLIDLAARHRIQGIICTNLTKNRHNPKVVEKDLPAVGGLSGRPVQDLADNLLAYIYKHHGARFVLVGSGGIFSAADAYRKIRRGASLVQLITGMIYEGPQLISEINRGLVTLLQRDGLKNISAAVGIDNC